MKRLSKFIGGISELKSLSGVGNLVDKDATKEDVLKSALNFYNQLRVNDCLATFHMLIDKWPDFTRGRLLGALIVDGYGDTESACQMLKSGVEDLDEVGDDQRGDQVKICVALGRLYLKLFDKNDEIKYHARPKEKNLDLALDYFQKATEFDEDDLRSQEMAAVCYAKMKKFESAKEIWEEIKDKDVKFLIQYVNTLEKLKDFSTMKEELEIAIEEHPRSFRLYELMMKVEKNKKERETLQKKSIFYRWVPSYCTDLEYSGRNYQLYERLMVLRDKGTHQKNSPYLVGFLATLNKLIDEDTIENSSMLISFIRASQRYGSEVVRAFEALHERTHNPNVCDLLFELLKEKNALASTIRNCVLILASVKYKHLLKVIVKMLLSDTHVFSKGIPEALGMLRDERAVPHLIRGVNLQFGRKHQDIPSGIGSKAHLRLRRQCCLALSYFRDSHEANNCLTEGLKKVPDLKLHCLCSLYRLERQKKYLDELENIVTKQKVYVGYDIYCFLRDKCKKGSKKRKVGRIIKHIENEYEKMRLKDFGALGTAC